MTIWINKLAVKMLSNNEFEIVDTTASMRFQISVREYTGGLFAAILNYGVCVTFDDYNFAVIEQSFNSCDNLIIKQYASKLAKVITALNDKGELSLIELL